MQERNEACEDWSTLWLSFSVQCFTRVLCRARVKHMMEQRVEPWTSCFVFRKNSVVVKCALEFWVFLCWNVSSGFQTDGPGVHIWTGLFSPFLYFFCLLGLSSHFPQRAVGQDFTISYKFDFCIHYSWLQNRFEGGDFLMSKF